MDFFEVRVYAPEALHEVLIAQLFGLGFDSFQELDDGFISSIEKDHWDLTALDDAVRHFEGQGVSFTF